MGRGRINFESSGDAALKSERQSEIENYLTSTLKMRHLKLLLSVANVGRIGTVAKAYKVSQPAISKQVAEIEAALGLQLFNRVGHNMRLTGAGEYVMRSASAMLIEMEELAQQLGSISDGISGKVALGGVATTFVVFVPPALAQFKRRAPNVSVSLSDGPADFLLNALRTGDIDLFVGRMHHRTLPDDIHQEDLLDDPTVIVSGTAHPLARKREVDWNSLAGQDWILPFANLPEARAMLRWLEERGVKLSSGHIESRSILANLPLIETSAYLSLMPRSIARIYESQERISRLSFPPCDVLGPLQLVWIEGRLSPAAKLLVECLRDVARKAS